MLNEVPSRGTPMPPTDPLIYRFYERRWSTARRESADRGGIRRRHHVGDRFRPGARAQAHPKGDRVKIAMSGKFLPYKYYGAQQGMPEYGFKEE